MLSFLDPIEIYKICKVHIDTLLEKSKKGYHAQIYLLFDFIHIGMINMMGYNLFVYHIHTFLIFFENAMDDGSSDAI